MPTSTTRTARVLATCSAVAACLAAPLLATPAVQATGAPGLPLGDGDLEEVRTTQTIAAGVVLTHIVRGDAEATPATIDTTTRGPWRVTVVSIDPRTARGHLSTTYGADISHTDRVTDLVRASGALVGVNASFFLIGTRNPGDPVGLAVHAGSVISEPAPARFPEVDVLVDSATNRLSYGHLSWSGRLRNRSTHATLSLQHLNHAPAVPRRCARLTDPTRCGRSGEVSSFTRAFGSSTPRGRGVEVIVNPSGCVVHRARTRGRALGASQRSFQATGRQTRRLLSMTRRGCLSQRVSLYRGSTRVPLRATTFAASGRYQLVRSGRVLEATGPGHFYERNPRTFVGNTRSGRVLMVTVDGRLTTSVGTTMQETAALARALGLYDAVNLDGGGSTTMSVEGALANVPSGSVERPVGDAFIYTDRPAPR